jgi:hypothetical protein
MLGNRAEAEDVAQEVFISVFKTIDTSARRRSSRPGCIGSRSTTARTASSTWPADTTASATSSTRPPTTGTDAATRAPSRAARPDRALEGAAARGACCRRPSPRSTRSTACWWCCATSRTCRSRRSARSPACPTAPSSRACTAPRRPAQEAAAPRSEPMSQPDVRHPSRKESPMPRPNEPDEPSRPSSTTTPRARWAEADRPEVEAGTWGARRAARRRRDDAGVGGQSDSRLDLRALRARPRRRRTSPRASPRPSTSRSGGRFFGRRTLGDRLPFGVAAGDRAGGATRRVRGGVELADRVPVAARPPTKAAPHGSAGDLAPTL